MAVAAMALAGCAGAMRADATSTVVSTARPAGAPDESVADGARDPRWAQPMALDGVPNLHKVGETLYRSAQPTAKGMRNLAAMGIRTVVNLRAYHSDADEIGETELGSVEIPMKPWDPEEDDIVRFLRIVADPARTPVLVHCQHGADRTGTACAIYRMAVCGWSKRDAIDEMTRGGFGYHAVWANLLRFIEKLDVEGLKRRAGLVR
jgi:protein tyrosine phosphatase (PTP) superfamily phosphohydrolase (DUF442 family)